MKRPKIIFGWGSAPDPSRAAYDALCTLSRLGRGHPLPIIFSPIDTFDRCSWTFVGTCARKKRGHPKFLKRGCALVLWVVIKMSGHCCSNTALAVCCNLLAT